MDFFHYLCSRFSLPLHKLSCISAKHASELDAFALDLH